MVAFDIKLLTNILKLKYNLTRCDENFKERIIERPDDTGSFKMDPAKMAIMTPILPKPYPFPLNVALRQSPVSGRGVFATKDIKVNSLLTLYPADIVQYCPDGIVLKEGRPFFPEGGIVMPLASDRMQDKLGKNFDVIEQLKKLKSYKLVVSCNYSILGDPSFDDNPLYLGHFINDGFRLLPASTEEKELEKAVALYSELSLAKMNCRSSSIADGLQTAIIATRDIKEGEELFMVYGSDYWLDQNKEN